jgi:hypothetical protein
VFKDRREKYKKKIEMVYVRGIETKIKETYLLVNFEVNFYPIKIEGTQGLVLFIFTIFIYFVLS